jgi:hypothetical protein
LVEEEHVFRKARLLACGVQLGPDAVVMVLAVFSFSDDSVSSSSWKTVGPDCMGFMRGGRGSPFLLPFGRHGLAGPASDNSVFGKPKV